MPAPTADEYLAKIAENTAKRIRTNAGDVERHSLKEQLELEARLRDRERQASGGLGFGLFKIRPGGPSS